MDVDPLGVQVVRAGDGGAGQPGRGAAVGHGEGEPVGPGEAALLGQQVAEERAVPGADRAHHGGGRGRRVPRAVGVDQHGAAAAERRQHRADASVDQGAGRLGRHGGVGLELVGVGAGHRRELLGVRLEQVGCGAGQPSTSAASGPSLVSTATRLTPRSRATRSA